MAAPNPFQATDATIATLRDVLDRISLKAGSVVADDVWHAVDNENASTFQHLSSPQEAIVNVRKRIRASRNIIHALTFLTRTLEEKTVVYEDRFRQLVLEDGLKSLPDELVLLVLKYAASTFQDLQRLSHVCSRFRRILLSSPRSWANCELDTHASSPMIRAGAARADNLPLKVAVFLIPHRPGWEDFLDDLFALGDRIEEIRFCLDMHHGRYIEAEHPHALLSELRSLSIEYSRRYPCRFYSSWVLPKLEKLEITGCIPLQFCSESLVECKFTFDRDSIGGVFTDKFSEFIRSLSSLRIFTIVLDNVAFCDHLLPASDYTRKITLSNIRTFSVHATEGTPLALVTVLGEMFNFPNIVTLSISTATSADTDGGATFMYEWMNGWIGQYCSSLRDLRLSLKGGHVDSGLEIYSDIQRYWYSALECLTLEVPDTNVIMDVFRADGEEFKSELLEKGPRLRTIRFIDCKKLEIRLFKGIHSDSQLYLNELEEIEVFRCANINREDVVSIFPNSKVVWTAT